MMEREQGNSRKEHFPTVSFSTRARDYGKHSQVQASASDELFQLLDIKKHEDVLDVGCGNGKLTHLIRQKTQGKVVGVDASEGMIEEAQRNHGEKGIEFRACPAESLNFEKTFDVIFSNSAFQWFKNPDQFLQHCHRALKMGGRMGIQAAAKRIYSPTFLQAIEEIKNDPRTKETFAHFSEPWFFLETPEEYKALFEKVGFHVLHAEFKTVHTPLPAEELFQIFNSASTVGYLGADFYDVPLSEEYAQTFRQIIQESFRKQANQKGMVDLVFHRIYLLAMKGTDY